MKWILVLALLAAGGFFAWKKYGPVEATGVVTTNEKTPGANQQNRVEGMAGSAGNAE